MPTRSAVLALLLLALVPACASADSIVYVKNGDVYASKPDGTSPVQVTSGSADSWPSQANDGTIALIQPSNGLILRVSKSGVLLNTIPTYATVDSTRWQTPERARISPDGSKIAFDQLNPG